jgi:hypothetical protein
MVLTSAYAQANEFEPRDSGPAGFLRVWDEWARFTSVYVLRDIPNTGGKQGPQCLAVHQGDPVACATPRPRALPPDALTEAGQVAGRTLGPRVRFLDFSRHFCDEQKCYAVVGGVPVYYDYDHMTKQFAVTLAPYLRRAL